MMQNIRKCNTKSIVASTPLATWHKFNAIPTSIDREPGEGLS